MDKRIMISGLLFLVLLFLASGAFAGNPPTDEWHGITDDPGETRKTALIKTGYGKNNA